MPRKATTKTNRRPAKKATYREVKIGKMKFTTSSKAVRYLLKRSKLSQARIAEKCNVTPACVCQLAAQIVR